MCLYFCDYLVGIGFQVIENFFLFNAAEFHFSAWRHSRDDPFAVFFILEEPVDLVHRGLMDCYRETRLFWPQVFCMEVT